ncbi:MAG: DUF2442 domain-containing protein [Nitrospirae bacterium]|uniref:DUF2442 domain-containing protein n=1 Tax=Candidatus Magnetobacterium casense TaxID=1455061 RepID=UPI00058BA704|nr:DUF2442 domain-containing protein [Candidatus Magnetobacterium casensis]MBF0338708.1 DUF2442 domain-containing protein [Nitrospirota bacterium]
MHEVKNAQYVKGYVLELEFEDGKKKLIDFEKYLYWEVFVPLKDVDTFRGFKVDRQLGTITWETGADFCPDTLYAYM